MTDISRRQFLRTAPAVAVAVPFATAGWLARRPRLHDMSTTPALRQVSEGYGGHTADHNLLAAHANAVTEVLNAVVKHINSTP